MGKEHPYHKTICESITKHESAFHSLLTELKFSEPTYKFMEGPDEYYDVKIPCYWSESSIPRFVVLTFKLRMAQDLHGKKTKWVATFEPFKSEPHTINWAQHYYISNPAPFIAIEQELATAFANHV